MGTGCQRRTALCFVVVIGLRSEILRNLFLQSDFTLRTVKEISSIQVLMANYFGWCREEHAWLAWWWCQAWGRQVGDGGRLHVVVSVFFDQFVIIFRSFFLPLIDPNNSVWRLLCPKFES